MDQVVLVSSIFGHRFKASTTKRNPEENYKAYPHILDTLSKNIT